MDIFSEPPRLIAICAHLASESFMRRCTHPHLRVTHTSTRKLLKIDEFRRVIHRDAWELETSFEIFHSLSGSRDREAISRPAQRRVQYLTLENSNVCGVLGIVRNDLSNHQS